MKIVVSTSEKYYHLLPVFFYLYNKYWGAPFDLLGYEKPACELPANCQFVSLGTQGSVNEWSTDLRRYFEQQDDWFIWLMEDTFIKQRVKMPADIPLNPATGKICLTNDVSKREHNNRGSLIYAHHLSRYQLSTMPSIWHKDYLLEYLTPGIGPWDFETQDPKNTGWDIIGFAEPPLVCNEGVRRFDIKKLNLEGMVQEDLQYIKTIIDKW